VSAARVLVRLLLPAVAAACAGDGGQARDVRAAIQRSVLWLEQHRPQRTQAPLGELGMDAWSWSLLARLHPDDELRRRAADEARSRLESLPREIEAGATALSWWAILLGELRALGMDDGGRRERIADLARDPRSAGTSPTTAFWSAMLLRHSGIDVAVSTAGTRVATLAGDDAAATPTPRDAVAIYHEVAPALDLGRTGQEVFTREELARVIELLPRLLGACSQAQDTDAAAEVLITAALLDDRDRPYYRQGISWLLERQRADGSFGGGDAAAARHGVLVATWALLESLRR